MKIIQLTTHFYPFLGGVENHVYNISKRLVEKGHENFIYTTMERGAAKRETVDGIEVRRFNCINLLPLPYGVGTFPVAMLQSILRQKADIIHAHAYGFPVTYIGALVRKLKRAPLVITCHSDPSAKIYPLGDALRCIPLLAADFVIALTSLEKARLMKVGIREDKIRVIPNGVSIPRMRTRGTNKYREDIGSKIVLCVARLDARQKGQDILLSAYKRVKKCFPNTNLILVGEGPDKDRLVNFAKKFNPNVIFTGKIREGEKCALISQCHALVLPSRSEPFGIALLEAMAYGKPFVASNVGGIPEIASDAGVLVNPTSKDLASGIITVLKSHELYRRRAEQHKLHVIRRFSWDNAVSKLLKVYELALRR